MRFVWLIILLLTMNLGCSKDFLSYRGCEIDQSERVYSLEELHEMDSVERNTLEERVITVEGVFWNYSEGFFLHGSTNDKIASALEFLTSPRDSARSKALSWENSERMNGSHILVKGKFDSSLQGHLSHGEFGIKEVCFFGKNDH